MMIRDRLKSDEALTDTGQAGGQIYGDKVICTDRFRKNGRFNQCKPAVQRISEKYAREGFGDDKLNTGAEQCRCRLFARASRPEIPSGDHDIVSSHLFWEAFT